jgi:hypothetical protein
MFTRRVYYTNMISKAIVLSRRVLNCTDEEYRKFFLNARNVGNVLIKTAGKRDPSMKLF